MQCYSACNRLKTWSECASDRYQQRRGTSRSYWKKLSFNELKNLKLYYPDFIEINTNSETNINSLDLNEKNLSSILCFTFVKNEKTSKKYEKIKKIKIYIDELKEEIIKILEN